MSPRALLICMNCLHCFCTWYLKWIMQIWVLGHEKSSRLPLSGVLCWDYAVSLHHCKNQAPDCSFKGLKCAWLHCASGYVPDSNINLNNLMTSKMLSSKCIQTLIVPLKRWLAKLLAKTFVNKALSVINQIYFAYCNCWFSASFWLLLCAICIKRSVKGLCCPFGLRTYYA